MSASAALMQSIVHTPTRLAAVSKLRIFMSKRPGSKANTQTQLRLFVERRLPILRFHNDHTLNVEIKRHAPGSALAKMPEAIGIQVTAGSRSFLLPHATTSDDELFHQILAIDRGEQVAGAVEGVLPDAAAVEAAAATARAAEPAAAAKAAASA